jgi:large subunit ribosomal protein L3
MVLKLMGKKRGMIQRFDKDGNTVVCTVIEAEPNVIAQIKTKENDGYDALQVAFEEVKTKTPETAVRRVGKPLAGHFAKAGVAPRRFLQESCVGDVSAYAVGQELLVSQFEEGSYVDVSAISKGKGYQGTMKLYNFGGGPAAHGSGFHRHQGSIGMRSTPGRCLPNGKRASRMGGDKVTVQSLKVVAVDADRNLLLVQGSVPGAPGGLVTIQPALKKNKPAKKK